MDYSNLTDKQLAILEFLKSEILSKGYPPAVRDICQAVGLRSTSTVHAHLSKLEELGYIHRDPSKPRAIEITDDSFNLTNREVTNVPMIGTVAAGQPILAEENIEDYFPIPVEHLPNSQVFMLRVKGDSMIQAGILSGDYVMVEQTHSCRNGDMIVAIIDGEATVKTFYREDDHIRLQPENDALSPILIGPDQNMQIAGKVFGVMRIMR